MFFSDYLGFTKSFYEQADSWTQYVRSEKDTVIWAMKPASVYKLASQLRLLNVMSVASASLYPLPGLVWKRMRSLTFAFLDILTSIVRKKLRWSRLVMYKLLMRYIGIYLKIKASTKQEIKVEWILIWRDLCGRDFQIMCCINHRYDKSRWF
jgi:hypothetical protein